MYILVSIQLRGGKSVTVTQLAIHMYYGLPVTKSQIILRAIGKKVNMEFSESLENWRTISRCHLIIDNSQNNSKLLQARQEQQASFPNMI